MQITRIASGSVSYLNLMVTLIAVLNRAIYVNKVSMRPFDIELSRQKKSQNYKMPQMKSVCITYVSGARWIYTLYSDWRPRLRAVSK